MALFRDWFIRFVGLMEVLGAIGLVVPAATRILPVLTPLTAIGLSVLQIAAIILHATRGETAMTLPANPVLLALALLVGLGRLPQRTHRNSLNAALSGRSELIRNGRLHLMSASMLT